MPHITNMQYLYEILNVIDDCNLCCGNEVTQFKDVITDDELHQQKNAAT